MNCPFCRRDIKPDPVYESVGAEPHSGRSYVTEYHAALRRWMAIGCVAWACGER